MVKSLESIKDYIRCLSLMGLLQVRVCSGQMTPNASMLPMELPLKATSHGTHITCQSTWRAARAKMYELGVMPEGIRKEGGSKL